MTSAPASLPRTADCVIVGGGAIGCSLAYQLALGGRRPVLLERAELGNGSTGRCAGGVRQQFSTAVNIHIGMRSVALLSRFEDEVGTTAAFRQIGYLFAATTDADAEQFRRNVALQRECGLADVQLLSGADAAELVPGLRIDDVTAATYCPSDGLAGPNEVTAGYAAAARRHGAVIVEGVEVAEVLRDPSGVAGVRTAAGDISTRTVVNCAGPYAGVIGDRAGAAVPVLPYRRHIFVTESFSLGRGIPMTVDFSTSFYFHPEGEGLLLGMSDPAEPSSFDTNVDWGFLEHLVEHATDRLPALERSGIATGWAGLYEVTPDHQGLVGAHPDLPGFWLCCGFSGHGFMQAPAIGELTADLLLDREVAVDLSALDPRRFAAGVSTPEAAII